MALDIGKLVGHIELDASGVPRGIKQADTAIKQAGGQWEKSTGDAGEKAGKAGGAKLSGALKKAIIPIGAGIIGAIGFDKITTFLRSTIDAASDLEQTMGGVDAVFGEYADNVHKNAARADQALGLSKNAYNELITVSGALLKNKGLEDFAAQSENLVQVGADLAAQFGGPTTQAVEALNALMRGEADPIERYGISINEVAIQAKLAEDGITGLEGAALETAKTQARLQLVMEQSADAQGTFAREADTAAGKAERQQAKLENLRTEIGERLLPVYHAWLDFMADTGVPALADFSDAVLDAFQALGPLVEAGQDTVNFFNDLPGPVKATVGALAGIKLAQLVGLTTFAKNMGGGIGRNAATGLDGIRLQAMYMGDAFRGAETKAGGLKAAIGTGGRAGLTGAMNGLKAAGGGVVSFLGGPWGLALLGAATAVGWWIGKNKEAEEAVQAHTDAIVANEGALGEGNRELIKTALQAEGVYDATEKLGVSLKLVTDAAMGNADAQKQLDGVLSGHIATLDSARGGASDLTKEEWELGAAAQEVQGSLNGQNEVVSEAIDRARQLAEADGETAQAAGAAASAQEGLTIGLSDGAGAADEYADSVDGVTDSTKDARDRTLELAEAMGEVIDQAFSAREADIAYEEALDSLTDALEENGRTNDITTEKGRENVSALYDLAQQARETAEANLANGDSLDSVRGRMATARDEFVKGAQQMGYTESAANALADELGLTEGAVAGVATEIGALKGKTVTVEVDGTGRSVLAVRSVKDEINGVKSKTVYVTVIETYNRGRRPAYARQPWAEADGGIWAGGKKTFADGGFDDKGRYVPRVPQMAGPMYGKTGIEWGEPVTGWEAYISGKPGMRSRNLAVMSQAADRLGVAVVPAANGALMGASADTRGPSGLDLAPLLAEVSALRRDFRTIQLRAEAVVTPSNAGRIVTAGNHANRKYGGG